MQNEIFTYHITHDIRMLCKLVPSFPNGISEAFDSLEQLPAPFGLRGFYGLSYMNPEQQVVYKVAATLNNGEDARDFHMDGYTLQRGTYLAIRIHDWMDQLPAIGTAFSHLMQEPAFDASYYCVEWYINDKEMMCLVRSKEQAFENTGQPDLLI